MAEGGGLRHLRRARSAGEAQAGSVAAAPRRRSERNVAFAAQITSTGKSRWAASKMVDSPHPRLAATRPITLKKIVPRHRQVKEAAVTPRRSPRISLKEGKELQISLKEDKENISRGTSSGPADAKTDGEPSPPHSSSSPPKAAILSPVNTNTCGSPPCDKRDLAMAQRVRRSYSRLEMSLTRSFLESQESPASGLSDTSTPSHGASKRQTLFGFEKLLAPDGLPGVSPVNSQAPLKVPAAELSIFQPQDTDIPGISFNKAVKRRKKKVPQFEKSELDEWAAQLNAEFEAAEKFHLHVE